MEVVIIKMSNGDELIADKERMDADAVIVNKPRIVFHDGSRGGLMPYCISNPDVKEFPIAKNLMVGMVNAPKALADEYMQTTTSILLG